MNWLEYIWYAISGYVAIALVMFIAGAVRIVRKHDGDDEIDGLMVWGLGCLIWPLSIWSVVYQLYCRIQERRYFKKRVKHAKTVQIHEYLDEYALIIQRKSKLPASERKKTVDFVEALGDKRK